MLTSGVELIGGRYFFFAASGNQLRDHRAVFVRAESQPHVVSLRNKIVKNPEKFSSAANYLSRVGLFLTADVSKGIVTPSDVQIIDDLAVKAVSFSLAVVDRNTQYWGRQCDQIWQNIISWLNF